MIENKNEQASKIQESSWGSKEKTEYQGEIT
jgi:hypothetical protein